jgi:DNA polymerase-1
MTIERNGHPKSIASTLNGHAHKARKAQKVACRLIRDASELPTVIAALDSAGQVAVDTETTGLNPRKERVRLLTLGIEGRVPFILDCFALNPSPVFKALARKPIILHNAAFDLAFLAALEFTPSGPVRDTLILSQLLHAGTPAKKGFHTLDNCLERELGVALNKSLQASDWSAPQLSADQLAYAALDVKHLPALHESLASKIKTARMERVGEIETRCLPALVWLAHSGVAFDVKAWEALARNAQKEADRLQAKLDVLAPAVNWNSPVQVRAAFAGLGVDLPDTTDGTLAAVDHSGARLLREYRGAKKRASTYGLDFLKHVETGRVHAGWNQCGARTGRMSSSKPNLQNLPRDPAYRRCFMAPPGRLLVKADYSQIELRIAAKISGDATMLEAYRDGLDLHVLTAQRLLDKKKVTEQDRQLAKSANFGLLYGQGAKGYQRYALQGYGVELTSKQAVKLRDGFFEAYPGLESWHHSICAETWQQKIGRKPAETRTLTGRRVCVKPDLWHGARASFAVQGTGGDGLKMALALLWERREQSPGAFPVLAVHDEIVVEAGADQADAVARWLKRAMLDAMAPLIDPVPVEVETKIGKTWGG